ncbi:MAG TPA: hypothetical protein VLZ03_14455 [Thermodesulfobacteriota bacterium]|nr:hypothetical protein [Thermodesulfobacteriota bacterium]
MIRSRWFDDRLPNVVRSLLLVSFLTILFFAFTPYFISAQDQETGTLAVTTTPVSGAIYVDLLLKGKKLWSGTVSAGTHVVTFGDVKGYITPSPQTVTVVADQTYYVAGLYKKLPSE